MQATAGQSDARSNRKKSAIFSGNKLGSVWWGDIWDGFLEFKNEDNIAA
jgi:hypothetical protein